MINKGLLNYITIQTVGSIVVKILNMILIIFLARKLSINEFGSYNLAWTIVSIFSQISDFGISNYGIRNLITEKQKIKFISNIFTLKILISIITFLTLIIFVFLIKYPLNQKILILLLGIILLPNIFKFINNIIGSVFDKLDHFSIVLIVQNIFIISINFIILFFTKNISYLFITFIISEFLYALYSYIYINKNIIKLRLIFNINDVVNLLIKSRSYALLSILGFIYFKIDIIVLSKLSSNIAVGYYSSIYKIFDSWMLIPSIFTLTFLPLLTKNLKNKNLYKQKIFKYIKNMFLLGILIYITIYLIAHPLILFLYGQKYINTVSALKILILAIPLTFVNIVLYNAFYSHNYQNIVSVIFLFSIIINLFLNILLIPTYSYLGSSIATVLTEVFNLIITTYLFYKYILSKYVSFNRN